MAWGWRKSSGEEEAPPSGSLCDLCDLKDDRDACSGNYQGARQSDGECTDGKARRNGWPMIVDQKSVYLGPADGPLDTYARSNVEEIDSAIELLKSERPEP